MFKELKNGQSIAVNGACLSVIDFSSADIRFDVVPETFRRTNLKDSQRVNLERAMPIDGRFEGHIISGHVDITTQLLERKKEGEGERFVFHLPEEISAFVVEKGSITVNGVSLTVASVSANAFHIAVIPHTLHCTNLGDLQIRDEVNVEADIMAKYLHKWQNS